MSQPSGASCSHSAPVRSALDEGVARTAVSSTDPPPDGRAARSRRTRERLVAALYGLIQEGDAEPSAAGIAARAGVSLRSFYVHFPSREDLHRDMARQATARVVGLLTPIDLGGDFAARVRDFAIQRELANEELAPLRRAAALQPASAALMLARDYGRQASRDQIVRVFAAELDRFESGVRRRRVAALDAVASGEGWDLLRTGHGLSPTEARQVVAEAATRLLAIQETA